MELDPEEPPSLEELQARYRKAEKIRNILARSRSALVLPTSWQPARPDPRGWLGPARVHVLPGLRLREALLIGRARLALSMSPTDQQGSLPRSSGES